VTDDRRLFAVGEKFSVCHDCCRADVVRRSETTLDLEAGVNNFWEDFWVRFGVIVVIEVGRVTFETTKL